MAEFILGIAGSLIAAALYDALKKISLKGYPTSCHLIGVAIAAVVFSFGTFLEPVTQAFLDDDPIRWSVLFDLRYGSPGLFIPILFFGGLLPGILTGSLVVKGHSLVHRMKLGAIWAPISLSIFDAISFGIARAIAPNGNHHLIGLGDFSFSLVSNLIGGIPGGVIIGLFVHLAIKNHLTS